MISGRSLTYLEFANDIPSAYPFHRSGSGTIDPRRSLDSDRSGLLPSGPRPVDLFQEDTSSEPYLGRYTHRVAISNNRLLRMEGEDVVFRFKDYRRKGQWRTQKIHVTEFIRRFLLHVLPFRFVRIRYFGLLANRHRQRNLEQCRELLGIAPPDTAVSDESAEEQYQRLSGVDPAFVHPASRAGSSLELRFPGRSTRP